jgi:hypothetical protein
MPLIRIVSVDSSYLATPRLCSASKHRIKFIIWTISSGVRPSRGAVISLTPLVQNRTWKSPFIRLLPGNNYTFFCVTINFTAVGYKLLIECYFMKFLCNFCIYHLNMRIITPQQSYVTSIRLCTSAYIRNYSYLWLFTESFPVTAYSKIPPTNLFYLLEPTRNYFVPIFHLMYKCFSYFASGVFGS